MDQRVQLLTTTAKEPFLSFFPFVYSGICSPLPAETLKNILTCDHVLQAGLRICLAQPKDMPQLYTLLRTYGNQPENYEDLEKFPENRLAQIVKNIAFCSWHRWFLTFLLWDQQQPIGFFQIDFYNRHVITDIYQTKLLPFWQPCFKAPLSLETVLPFASEERKQWLKENFNTQAFFALYACVPQLPDPQSWLNFLHGSLEMYADLNAHLTDDRWIGNISYNLIPQYQHCGIMTAFLNYIQSLCQGAHCYALFSDRIAEKNAASMGLLMRNDFALVGRYNAHYGSVYQTRKHPQGNFSEPCVCFCKRYC